jgi:hypothetical protein
VAAERHKRMGHPERHRGRALVDHDPDRIAHAAGRGGARGARQVVRGALQRPRRRVHAAELHVPEPAAAVVPPARRRAGAHERVLPGHHQTPACGWRGRRPRARHGRGADGPDVPLRAPARGPRDRAHHDRAPHGWPAHELGHRQLGDSPPRGQPGRRVRNGHVSRRVPATD